MSRLDASSHSDNPAAQQPLTLQQNVERALAHGERASQMRPVGVVSPSDSRRRAITDSVHAATEGWLNGVA